MRDHMRQPFHLGGHSVDEYAALQFQRQRESHLPGEFHGAFEIGPRNQVLAYDTPVGSHTPCAVERHHAVVGNPLERSEVVRRTPRSDKEPDTPRMRPHQRIACRGGYFMGLETDQRTVYIEENSSYHRL